MAIPDYQSMTLPLLKLAGDKAEHSFREAVDYVSKVFKLTEEEKRVRQPSGVSLLIDNRVGWALTYLKKANLVHSKRRAYFKITERGLEVLKNAPSRIDIKFLSQYPEFRQFQTYKATQDSVQKITTNESTPEELIDEGYMRLRNTLEDDLLQKVKASSPTFFEQLVVDLLLSMGYGGLREDAAELLGRSGDEGVDGVIKQDKLGLDLIYIQAKKWEGAVSRPEIQKFVGALQGQKARKGIFITTSRFSQEAINYASGLEAKVRLIDGEQLAKLMIEHSVGVTAIKSYDIKRVDSDYFQE